ncbi:SHOCT domain-containing protein [Halocatena pleomorpha]|uniref:SHOCT domain-containing protein n=1 Tax=Halocatena pleomorpha TaxID=1785090 RepID=A0A3P3R7E9_9EURY|nr:SHOCT domain-containing protein [Halocatena pleomorpha]RRJ29391.1 hypothetical protein EIK79_12140 [Halocatena pleomorpha]
MPPQRTTDDTLRIILIVLTVIVLGPILLMLLAFPMMGMWGGMVHGGRFVSPLWNVGMMLVWFVILVSGGYLVYRWLSNSARHGSDPALEELRLAYARGEISEEEYEQRRSKLDTE